MEQLASTVQSSDISLLVKEVTGNVKKCDMTRQAAGNVSSAHCYSLDYISSFSFLIIYKFTTTLQLVLAHFPRMVCHKVCQKSSGIQELFTLGSIYSFSVPN